MGKVMEGPDMPQKRGGSGRGVKRQLRERGWEVEKKKGDSRR